MARAPSSVSFHAKGDESGERRVVGLTTRSRIPLRDSAGLEPDFPQYALSKGVRSQKRTSLVRPIRATGARRNTIRR